MSSGMNRVILIGNLGQDPELRHTQGGGAVLTLRMATTESFQNRDGERQERTDWHTVKLWGKRAEGLANVLSKGSRLCVEGRIQYSQWEDKQGGKRTSTEINATNVVLLGGGAERGDRTPRKADGGGTGGRSGGYGGGGGGFPEDDFGDSDIPFIHCGGER